MLDDFLADLFQPEAPSSFFNRFHALPGADAPPRPLSDLIPPGVGYDSLPSGLPGDMQRESLSVQPQPRVSLPVPDLPPIGLPPPPKGQFDTGLGTLDDNIIPPQMLDPSGKLPMTNELSARANTGGIPLPPERPMAMDASGPSPMMGGANTIPPPPSANPGLVQALRSFLPGNGAAPSSVQSAVPNGSANPLGIDDRKLARFRAALAGGLSHGNPNFKLGAAMQGAGGALAAGNKQDKDFRDEDFKERGLVEKEKTGDVYRGLMKARTANVGANADGKEELIQARTQAILNGDQRKARLLEEQIKNFESNRQVNSARTKALTDGKPNGAWNKPASERWKDANKLIIDKKKELYGDLPLAGKARETAKAAADAEFKRFKDATFKKYGMDPDGNDIAPAPRKGGAVPSTDTTVGDKEATDAGLYSAGTYDDPAKPTSKEEFDAIEPGTYFVNPADGQVMRKRG